MKVIFQNDSYTVEKLENGNCLIKDRKASCYIGKKLTKKPKEYSPLEAMLFTIANS